MALDKLVDSSALDADLTSIGNAIRYADGTSGTLVFPTAMVNSIRALKPTGTKSITLDGTTNVAGYEYADVNVGATNINVGGGISATDDGSANITLTSGYGYTLLGSTTLSANTTSTTNTSIGNVTIASAWTSAKIIYVRVRDTAGKRAGYFYGSDVWFINPNPKNGSTSSFTYGARAIIRYTTSSQYAVYSGTGYGVYGYDISSSGSVRIYTRYNSSYSLTINGSYKCEVYALDFPDGVTPLA